LTNEGPEVLRDEKLIYNRKRGTKQEKEMHSLNSQTNYKKHTEIKLKFHEYLRRMQIEK
jgi:hypothetical protein